MNIKKLLIVSVFLIISHYGYNQIVVERIRDNVKVSEVYYDNGEKVITIFKSDTNCYNVIAYFSNGNLKESYYTCDYLKNNIQYDGAYIEYYSTGIIKSIKYYDRGKAIGVWYDYFESGKLAIQRSYTYDSSYYYNSPIEYDITIGDSRIGIASNIFEFSGLPNGKWVVWYENGKIACEKYFSHGLEVSTWIWYYDNGNKRKEGSFYTDSNLNFPDKIKMIVAPDDIEDKIAADFFPHVRPKDGKWLEWSKDGIVKSEKIYKQGKLIKENLF